LTTERREINQHHNITVFHLRRTPTSETPRPLTSLFDMNDDRTFTEIGNAKNIHIG
jgi:hypothetical protein